MPKKSSSHRECTENCSSVEHAKELIAAVTLPCAKVTDKQLASYFKSKCFNFHLVQDELSRRVLHIAASCGRKDLCQWLIKFSKASIDDQDTESGYTSLHRAVLYGFIDVAVSLIQLGASLNITDREDFIPVDLTLKSLNYDFISFLFQSKCETDEESVDVESSYDNLRRLAIEKRNFLAVLSNAYTTEVYTWGTNQNYTLGFGAESGKACPEYLEFFDKKNEIIIDIQMHKYHTLFLSVDGNVWSCGLGQGGRLGLSSDSTILIPQKVVLTSKVHSQNSKSFFCLKIAIGNDHSIFMCNHNQILTCGLNTYHQLGISPPPSSVSAPQLVDTTLCRNKIIGVTASTFHSVFWTSNTIYTCGLHAGQLGRPYSIEKTVSTFQKVHLLDFQYTSITHVAASEAATVIVTDAHDIYLLSGYKMEKIDFRYIITLESLADVRSVRDERNNYLANPETVLKVAVFGGELDSDKVKTFNLSYRAESLQIAVLLSNGSLFLRGKNCTQFLKCDFLKKHEIRIADVHLNSCGMLLCSYKGEAFNAQVQSSVKTFGKVKDDFVKVNHRNKEETKECYLVKLIRIPNAYRSVRIFSEPSSSNFALLQVRSAGNLGNLPDMRSDTIASDIRTFYEETCEFDSFSDITFKVGKKSFPAHKYILASCSEELLSKENKGVAVIENVNADIFEQLLLYVYTGTCCFLQDGPCTIKIDKTASEKHSFPNSPKSIDDPLKLSIKIAQEFKMIDYVKAMRNFRYENEFISQISPQLLPKRRLRFNRSECRHLFDIKLKSQDGQVFHAHKCVLAARVEYFKSMLCGSWIESSDSFHEHRLPISGSVLLEMLEFVYTDTVLKPIYKKDFNFWCSLLVAADQFILPKLIEICENAIAQCLDTRNVCDVVMFADAIYASQLKISCFEFISANLSSLLHTRMLDKLNDTQLRELTEYYRNQFRFTETSSLKPLNIPVYCNACKPEVVVNAESSYPVDWEIINESFVEETVERKSPKMIQKKKKKPAIRKPLTSETDHVVAKEHKTPVMAKTIPPSSPISVIQAKVLPPPSQWVIVDKHLKSVKTRLKVNAAVKSCPQLIEQKENYTPLNVSRASPKSPPLDECKEEKIGDDSSRVRTYSIEIDFQNITPKLSQKQKKKLRRISESEKSNDLKLSSQNETLNGSSSQAIDFSPTSNNSSGCWGKKSNNSEAVNFSAIVASEKKQKTMVKKETRKMETKPLHVTQIEDKAIQELIAFYDASYCDEECVTVQRVIYRTAAPRWVTK